MFSTGSVVSQETEMVPNLSFTQTTTTFISTTAKILNGEGGEGVWGKRMKVLPVRVGPPKF